MKDEIAAAEKRGYAKGYQAGKRRIDNDQRKRERQEFLDRAFIAVLPAALNAQGWTRGDDPIKTLPDRVQLANDCAREALKQRPIA